MDTREHMTKNEGYKKALADCKSELLHRGEKLFPMCCFGEPRNWDEIAKELDSITEKYGCEFPEFDLRPVRHGYTYIETRKDGKKRIWIE